MRCARVFLYAVLLTPFLAGGLRADVSPPSSEGPVRVWVSVVLLDVDDIDAVQQSFVANVYYQARWEDPRLAHEGDGEVALPLDDIWHPRIQIVNQQRITTTLPRIAEVSPEGDVIFRQRAWGPFSQPLDFQDFPFDRQRFELTFGAVGFPPEDVELLQDPEVPSTMATSFSVADWEVDHFDTVAEAFVLAPGIEAHAAFTAAFEAERQSAYFILKVIVPLVLIIAMAGTVFWLDPENAATQIGVSTTSMLTLIAYRFAVGGFLPAVPYLTRMDEFLLGSTLLVFATVVTAVATVYMASHGHVDRAQRTERWCRWFFPIIALSMIVSAFFF